MRNCPFLEWPPATEGYPNSLILPGARAPYGAVLHTVWYGVRHSSVDVPLQAIYDENLPF